MVPIEQKDGTSRCRFPHVAWGSEAEVPDSCATITVMKNISFRSSFESPIKLRAPNSIP
jgi:hypothetical protein